MNHLSTFTKVKNRYFIMRHGLSEANVQSIIVSNPNRGISFYGLVQEGKNQVEKAAEAALKQGVFDRNTLIYSSDFLRCQETAHIVQNVIHNTHLMFTSKLHERFYGDFDGEHNGHYELVREMEKQSPDISRHNIETIAQVTERVTSLIAELEEQYENETILLVSHGFPCAVLDAVFRHIPVVKFPDNLGNAEIRELKFQVTKG